MESNISKDLVLYKNSDLLTIVVPTYNRPKMLANLIRYLHGEFSIAVLILDSSDDKNYEINVKNINNAFEHVRYSKDIKFKEKLVDGLKRVHTRYCVFCADDDIVVLDALLKCVNFLEVNPDYIGAQGYYFGFDGGNGKYLVDDIIYNNKSIDELNILPRLDTLFTEYQSNFYSVFRTDIQIDALIEASKNESPLFFELMQSSYGVIKGKVKRLPIIYAGRCRAASVDVPRQWHPVEWVSADINDYFSAYINYRNNLVSLIEESIETKYDLIKLKNIVDLIHAKYTFGSLGVGVLQTAINAQINLCDDKEIIGRAFSALNNEFDEKSYLFRVRVRKLISLFGEKIEKIITNCMSQMPRSTRKRFFINENINVEFNNIVLEKIRKDNISVSVATKTIYKILEKYN